MNGLNLFAARKTSRQNDKSSPIFPLRVVRRGDGVELIMNELKIQESELANEKGIVRVPSRSSFEETFERLESTVASKGLTVFARVDFSGDAGRAGLEMNPTRMLVFGSPKAGTPLMVASATLALDLPLKVLVSQDNSGKEFLSYNSSEYLKERHNVPEELLKNISGIGSIVDSVKQ